MYRDLVGFIISLIFGLYVFYRNPQGKINLSFFIFAMAVAGIDFASYSFQTAATYDLAYFWSLGYVTYHWSTLGQYLFILALTENWPSLWSKFNVKFIYIPAVIITLAYVVSLAFLPNLVNNNGVWEITQGNGIIPVAADGIMAIWTLGIYVVMFNTGMKFYKSTFDPIKKKQLIYFVTAFVIAILVDFFGSLKWLGIVEFSTSIFSGMSVFSAILVVAIVKYDLMAINASNAADSIIATMSDAVFLLSTDNKIRLVNNAAVKMLAMSSVTIVGLDISNFLHTDEPKLLKEKLKHSHKHQKEVSDLEGLLHSDKSGIAVPVSISLSPILSSKNRAIRGVVCIVRDISDRKTQERRLQSSYESIKMADLQIRVELAKLQATFSSIGEGLVFVDDLGKIAMANTSAMTQLGWRENQIIGKDFVDMFRVTDEKGSAFPFYMNMKAAQKKGIKLKYSMSDSVYVSGRNKRIPVSVTSAPVFVGEGVIGSIIIFENVTREMEIDKAKSEFVSLAAHQLRTPITAIMWNLEVLEPEIKEKLGSDLAEISSTTYRQAANMANLVNQFLNVSRIELGKLSVKPQLLNIGPVLADVVAEQKVSYEQKKQHVVVTVAQDIPEIPLDKVLIRIVMQNLVSNAIKYTPDAGKIEIAIKKDIACAIFTVKDTGMGIPEAQQKNLFNKLFRADNAVRSGLEGNGLGLYLVKSIVRLMKGEISLTSVENKGTTFTVTIPYKGMKEKEGTRGLVEVSA